MFVPDEAFLTLFSIFKWFVPKEALLVVEVGRGLAWLNVFDSLTEDEVFGSPLRVCFLNQQVII